MATTEERNQNLSRPKKSAGKRLKRQREQKKRLIALGLDAEVVRCMNSRDVRTKLQHPKKTVAEAAAAAAAQ